ncbi:beta-klotho [Erythrolamprus reginae]|uniref:beta-klotho n=1 Tax=Erythrolamprus reginae TaxID=121349 RepID=UPI00396D0073
MAGWHLKSPVAFWALIFIQSVSGFRRDGISVWVKDPHLSPVNETQLFVHDTFPPQFLWGVGTSAFQVEGSLQEDGRGTSIWDHFLRSNLRPAYRAKDWGNSYRFPEKDLAALNFLGVSSYHFSISWPRLFPTGTVTAVNRKGLSYYNRLLDALVHRGIEPVVTLYHWDLPWELQEKYGGWENDSLADAFNDYATFCFRTFGDRVKYWITMHNPYLIAWHGYGTGLHAPGERREGAAYVVGHNLIKAHAKVWHNYDQHFRPQQGGFLSITLGSHWISPSRINNQSDIEKCQLSMQKVLGWFAKPIHGDGDYPEELKIQLGSLLPNATPAEIKYFKGTADFFSFSFGPNNFKPSSLLPKLGQNFSLDLRAALNWIRAEYDNPRIFITENGWFTNKEVKTEDTTAMYTIKTFINMVLQAIKYDQVDVFGYTLWSLLDGFEWQQAFNDRRGLFYVDFESETKERIPKSSAFYYKKIIQENGFPAEELARALQGKFPWDFFWGVTESVIKTESVASSPQFSDHNLYLWNVTGDGKFYQVKGVKLKNRPGQCTDFTSIKTHLQLLSKMNVTHYRFAFNWSLLLPSGNASSLNRHVLRYYRCLISEILKHKVKPVVTLHYPTHQSLSLPGPLLQHGGWLNQSTIRAFRTYAEVCFREFGDLVKLWITINEPNRFGDIYNSSGNDTYQAAHNLLIAHATAWQVYEKLYRSFQKGQVSLSLHFDWAEPAIPFLASHLEAANRFLQFEMAWFLDPLLKTGDYPSTMRKYLGYKNRKGLSSSFLPFFTEEETELIRGAADFVAVNHFTTRFVAHETKNGSRYELDQDIQLIKDSAYPISPTQSAVVPWGLRKALNWINQRYGNVDIYITASGIEDPSKDNDELRKYYLEKYLQEAFKAYRIDKVNLKGYFAFKLTDEAAKPKIGFFTSELQAKASVSFYNQLICNNGFPVDPTKKCGPQKQMAPCTFCRLAVQDKPLIFLGCCVLATLIILLSILAFQKRKKKRQDWSKYFQHVGFSVETKPK